MTPDDDLSLIVLADTMVATWAFIATRKKSERARAELDRFGDALTGRTIAISGQS